MASAIWAYLKKNVEDRNFSNLEELEAIYGEEINKICISVFCYVIRNYQKWLTAIIENKGYAIHYWSKRANNFVLW